MKEHYFDDLKVGDRFKSEPLDVTEKQVIEFAHKFDPQMFHLNRKAAERTLFKGLIASGWHTAAITMRLFVQTLNFAEGAIGLISCVGPMWCGQAMCLRLRRRLSIHDRRARDLTTGSFACAMSRLINEAKLCRRCSQAPWCHGGLTQETTGPLTTRQQDYERLHQNKGLETGG